MQRQIDLLRTVNWDLLVVLDACRADTFQEVTGRGEAVLTPGRNTPAWVARVAPLFNERGVTYFTANPMVDSENELRNRGLTTVRLWDKHWGYWSEHELPTVHPASAVAAYLERAAERHWPHVLHLMQPHAPYIGRTALGCACGEHVTAVYPKDLPTVWEHMDAGLLDWPTLRLAYRDNLRLAWEAVRALLAQVEARVVITSDHGELLGEYGLYGHRQLRLWKKPETLQVPWLVVDARPEQVTQEARLAALGYL